MTARLPAHLEVAALIRLAEVRGGSGMVLAKGERDAGVILLSIVSRGRDAELFERMPDLDGSRAFVRVRAEDPESPGDFSDYLERRRRQDPDTWIVELDVDDRAQLLAVLPG
jgi:hypothetical protein